ncbi:hypothetical protein GCM10009619_27920 [Williamsia maris]
MWAELLCATGWHILIGVACRCMRRNRENSFTAITERSTQKWPRKEIVMWTGGSQRNVQLYQKNSSPCQARGNGLEALRGAIQPVAAGHLSLVTSVQPAGG